MRNLSIKEKVQEGIVGRISMTIIYIHFTSFAYECYKVPLTKTTCSGNRYKYHWPCCCDRLVKTSRKGDEIYIVN